jgi:hypothetical protein
MAHLRSLVLGLTTLAICVSQALCQSSTDTTTTAVSSGPFVILSGLSGRWVQLNSSYSVTGNATLEVNVLNATDFSQAYLYNGSALATGVR